MKSDTKIQYSALNRQGLAKQIADSIQTAILEGRLLVDERLPSEHDLAERFEVSRPTVREALKRLAAQNLIRTQRGATGGVFVNRVSWSEAHDTLLTTSTLLLGMNEINFDTVAEARLQLESACIPLACQRRDESHLKVMCEELEKQRSAELSDEEFCASDVRFHRSVVDAAGNPILSFQMVGIVEAMQPLMNMLTYQLRDRNRIADCHERLLNAIENQATDVAQAALNALCSYVAELAGIRSLNQKQASQK